jgi:hypothetical protein
VEHDGAIAAEGKVRWIGVSNFDVEQMKRAQAIAPITSLQPRLLAGAFAKWSGDTAILRGIGNRHDRLFAHGLRIIDGRHDAGTHLQAAE